MKAVAAVISLLIAAFFGNEIRIAQVNSADAESLVRETCQKLALPVPRQLPVLSQAADRILELSVEGGASTPAWSERVAHELQVLDIVEPQVVPILIRGDSVMGLSAELAALLSTGVAPGYMNRFGAALARADGEYVLCVILLRSVVQLSPLERELDVGDCHFIWGKVQKGFHSPRALIMDPAENLSEKAFDSALGLFWGNICYPAAGQHTMEILADGQNGPETAALYQIWVGMPRPALASVKLCSDSGEVDPAATIFRLVNEERARRQLEPVKWDESLQGCATAQADAMARQGVMGHDLGEAAAGNCPGSRENIALDSAACTAHHHLMASPSHRKNILDPAAALVGIGVSTRALGNGLEILFVAEKFAAGTAVQAAGAGE